MRGDNGISMSKLRIILNFWRLFPTYMLIEYSDRLDLLRKDTRRWKEICGYQNHNEFEFLSTLLLGYKEYRNLVYNRMETSGLKIRSIFRILFPLYDTLFIHTNEIGSGLFIQHGFSTIINAEHIGKNCFINQQVTIGADKPGERLPWIGENVRICAGAIIVGNVHIGDNACIGAGAVVVKDVNDNEIVAGVPAKPIGVRKR